MTEDSFNTPLEKIDKSLSEVFNTTPLHNDIVVYDDATVEDAEAGDVSDDVSDEGDLQRLEQDVAEARDNIKKLIYKGDIALNYAIDLAKVSDRASAFEAVSSMIKTLTDSNSQLLDLHKKKTDIKKIYKNGNPVEDGTNTINQTNNTAVFIGTTAELSEMIKKNRGVIE